MSNHHIEQVRAKEIPMEKFETVKPVKMSQKELDEFEAKK